MTTTEIKFKFYTDDRADRPVGWYGYARDYTLSIQRSIADWCKQNLKEDSWHVEMSNAGGYIEVYLQNERDYIMFLLRWS